MTASAAEFGEDDLRALLGQHAGGAPLDLGPMLRSEPLGVFFAPEPHAWSLLEPADQSALAPPDGLGVQVVADGIQPHWRRVLPLPFTPSQLLRFAEYAQLPELCRWMELEPDSDRPEFNELRDRPSAHMLAVYLAGGPEPQMSAAGDQGAISGLSTVVTESVVERRQRRLARFYELGGLLDRGGHVAGRRGALADLAREEQAAGRPQSDPSDVKRDLDRAQAQAMKSGDSGT